MGDLYIGLMSGTSLDGVDGVLAELAPGGGAIDVRAHGHRPYDAALAAELLALNRRGGADELHRAALAANAVARAYAEVCGALLRTAAVGAEAVRAIGAHGQTVRHQPQAFDRCGYTLQLLNPALLAEATGIDVVADFRSRDLAAGGQGAPLVPAFHRALFGRPGRAVAVVNIGGMSNLTVLAANGATRGFDTGPGNVLMDLWTARCRGAAYDNRGSWAASGRLIAPLLGRMLAEPFFAQRPPRSTGRDRFDAAWLDAALRDAGIDGTAAPDEDVQATLAELTARCIADAVHAHAADASELIVCGGGAANEHLVGRLAALLAPRAVVKSDERGLPPTQVEAAAFAWLAQALVERRPAALPSVTGATAPRVLGALWPGR